MDSKRKAKPPMKTGAKRILSLILLFSMLLSFLPYRGAKAASEEGWETGYTPSVPIYKAKTEGKKPGVKSDDIGLTTINYRGDYSDYKGSYIKFAINHDGVTEGWEKLLIHVDPYLYPYLDLQGSYIKNSEGKDINLESDYRPDTSSLPWWYPRPTEYCKDQYTYMANLSQLFGKGSGDTLSSADLYLKIKDPDNQPQEGQMFAIENRLARKSGSNIEVRRFYYGDSNYYGETNKVGSNTPATIPNDYDTYTTTNYFEYGRKIDESQYQDVIVPPDQAMINSNLLVELDPNENILRLRYVYSTKTATLDGNDTSFIVTFPTELFNAFDPAYRNSDKAIRYYHVGHQGYIYRSTDDLPYSEITTYTGNDPRFVGMSGLRILSKANKTGVQKAGIYKWLNIYTTGVNDRPRVNAASITTNPIQNVFEFRIDPLKYNEIRENLPNYRFSAMLYTKDGKILRNSDTYTTGGATLKTPYIPSLDDIYVGDTVINGKTNSGKANGNFNFTLRDGEGHSYSKSPVRGNVFSVNRETDEFAADIFNNLKKDSQISVRVTDNDPVQNQKYNSYYGPSDPYLVKVKARAKFHYNNDQDTVKEFDVPANEKYASDPGYVPNGFGKDKMPEKLESEKALLSKEGKTFLGWATKPDFDVEDFVPNEDGNIKAPKLTKLDQWNDDSQIYLVDGDSPIDRNVELYGVWKENVNGVTFVLHTNYQDSGQEEKTYEYYIDNNDKVLNVKELTSGQIDTFGEQLDRVYKDSPKAILPNAYIFYGSKEEEDETDKGDGQDLSASIFEEKQSPDKSKPGGFKKYNLVGWTTDADNSGAYIEDIFANKAMIAKDDNGDWVMAKVGTNSKEINQTEEKKEFVKLPEPDDKGEIHLYAAWRPYFDINLEKTWYERKESPEGQQPENIDVVLNNIAHGGATLVDPINDKDRMIDLQIGLIRRTAVTDSDVPTVVEDANYYKVDNSLQRLAAGDKDLHWYMPGYDSNGKRYSYVSVEFETANNGADRFNSFSRDWSSIWTSVLNNLGAKNWSDANISKVQTVSQETDERVDAYSGATIRILQNDEKDKNLAKVGAEGRYNFSLYNVKEAMNAPAIQPFYVGDNFFHIDAPRNSRAYADVTEGDNKELDKELILALDIPDQGKIYFKFIGDTWKMVSDPGTPGVDWPLVTDPKLTNRIKVEKSEMGGNKTYKFTSLNEDGKRTYRKNFAPEDMVKASYQNERGSLRSGVSTRVATPVAVAPKAVGLIQEKARTIDGQRYTIAAANQSNDVLSQFTDHAHLYLVDADSTQDLFLVDKDNKLIEAKREGDRYVFQIPEGAKFVRFHQGPVEGVLADTVTVGGKEVPNLIPNSEKAFEDGSNIVVYNTDRGKTDVRSDRSTKMDLKAPEITADNITMYRGQGYEQRPHFTMDENAKFVSMTAVNSKDGASTENFNAWFSIEKMGLSTEDYVRQWAWKTRDKDNLIPEVYTAKVTFEDKFGNEGTKEITVTIKEREKAGALEGTQAPREGGNYRIAIKNPEDNPLTADTKVQIFDNASPEKRRLLTAIPYEEDGIIYVNIPTSYKQTIEANNGNLNIAREEKDQLLSDTTPVHMQTVAPNAVSLVDPEPGSEREGSKFQINDIDEKARYIEISSPVFDTITLQKIGDEWTSPNTNKAIVSKTETGIEVRFPSNVLREGDRVSAIAMDEMKNSAPRVQATTKTKQLPAAPTDVFAGNTDQYPATTTVSGKAEPNMEVHVYKQKLDENGKGLTEKNPAYDPDLKAELGDAYSEPETIPVLEEIGMGKSDDKGNFEVQAEPRQAVGSKVYVKAVASDGLESKPVEAIVVADANNNKVDDKNDPFDFTRVKSMEVVEQPKLDYPQVNENSEKNLDLEDMRVELIDDTGKKVHVIYTAEGIPSFVQEKSDKLIAGQKFDPAMLKTAPAHGAELSKDNNGKAVTVTYVNDKNVFNDKPITADTEPIKFYQDKNNNGKDDATEGFDWKNMTSIEVISWPDKMTYEDKDQFAPKGLALLVNDITGKEAMIVYREDGGDFKENRITIKPADKTVLSAENFDKGDNNRPLVIEVAGSSYVLGAEDGLGKLSGKNAEDNAIYESAARKLEVIFDENGDGIDDRLQDTKLENVQAFNNTDDKSYTKVKGITDPGAEVEVLKDGKKVGAGTAGDDGSFNIPIDRLPLDTELTVKATSGYKRPATKDVTVGPDENNNEVDDRLEKDLKITDFKAYNMIENKGSSIEPLETQVTGYTAPGATVTVTNAENDKEETTVANKDGKFTVILQPKLTKGTEVKAIATKTENGLELKGTPVTTKVYEANENLEDLGIRPNTPSLDQPIAGDQDVKVVVNDVDPRAEKITVKVNDVPKVFVKDGSGFKPEAGGDFVDTTKGKYVLPVDELKAGDKVEVTVSYKDTSDPENPVERVSKPATAEVLPAPDTTAPAKPEVAPVNEGDKTVNVKAPTEADADKITIKVTPKEGEPKTVQATKTPSGWEVDGKAVDKKDGKLQIPVDGLKQGDKVEVTVADDAEPANVSDPTQVTVGENPLKKDLADKIAEGEKFLEDKGDNIDPEDKKNVQDAIDQAKEDLKKFDDPNQEDPTKGEVDKDKKAIDDSIANIKDRMDTPVVKPVKVGDTNITGTGIKGAKIKVTKPDNKAFSVEVEVRDDMTWSLPVDKIKAGDQFTVVQIDPTGAKKDSMPVNVSPERVDSQGLKDAIAQGEKALTDNPNDPKTKEDQALEDAIQKGKDLFKDSDPSGELKPEPTQEEVNKAAQDILDAIKAKEDADKNKAQVPLVNDDLKKGSDQITGTAKGNKSVDIYKNGELLQTVPVNDLGNFKADVKPLDAGDVIIAKAGELESKPVTVKANTDKLEETKGQADQLVEDLIKEKKWDPDALDENQKPLNPFDKNLKDKIDQAKDILDRAKDGDETNDPSQKEVDKAEEELRDAMNKKNAHDAVKDLETRPEDKPVTQEDIDNAQKLIDEIKGSTDPTDKENFDQEKKDLQDRLDEVKKKFEEGNKKQIYIELVNPRRGNGRIQVRSIMPGVTVKVWIDDQLVDTNQTNEMNNSVTNLQNKLQRGQIITVEGSMQGYESKTLTYRVR